MYPDSTDRAFFVSSFGRRYSKPGIQSIWNRLRSITDIGKNVPRAPRLHDFRHTFACNFLLKAYREKRDIDKAVHLLSIYLGHSSVIKTYWYLTGIPALMQLVSERVESNFKY